MNANKTKFVTISEDSVQCHFFTCKSGIENSYWIDLQNKIQQCINKLSCSYMWHKDTLEVNLPIPNIKSNCNVEQYHLHSTVQFGDNIEDEWFIVYLVLEITSLYDDIVCQVNDSDGEFLLIEAADFLPNWINPDNAENRVYIYKGQIHIIPPDIVSIEKEVGIEDAISAILQFPNKTKASDNIMCAIKNRIAEYPQKIQHNFHRAVVEIPCDIACLLLIKPSLISAIVHAYCNHDLLDAKYCRNIKTNETYIETTVTFTKCLYAMLRHSKSLKRLYQNDKKKDLGFKILAGYTILMSRSTDVFKSKDWGKYLNNLNKMDYFRGNLEGSKNYVQLLEQAKEYFIKNECASLVKIANEIEQLKISKEYNQQYELLKKKDIALIDDSDDWLNIHPNQLEDLLKCRYGKQAKFEDKGMMTPHAISNQLSKFLQESSDFEGIETKNAEEVDDDNDNNIFFDVNSFNDELNNIVNDIFTKNNNSDDSDNESIGFSDSEMKTNQSPTELDFSSVNKSSNILLDFKQSVIEEGALAGPSSLLLKNIGINKQDLLDSDDDDM